MKYKFRIKPNTPAGSAEPAPAPAPAERLSSAGASDAYDETERLLQEILRGGAGDAELFPEGEDAPGGDAVEDFDKVAFMPDEFEGDGTVERKISFEETDAPRADAEAHTDAPSADIPVFDGEKPDEDLSGMNFEGYAAAGTGKQRCRRAEGRGKRRSRRGDQGNGSPAGGQRRCVFGEDGFSDSAEGDDGEDDEDGDEEERKKAKKKRTKLLLCIFLPILGVLLLLFILLQILLAMGKFSLFGMDITKFDLFGVSPTVYSELSVEVGTPSFEVTDFVNRKYNPDGKSAELQSGVYDLNRLGKYDLTVSFAGESYNVTLRVVDTVAPTADVKCALFRRVRS